MGGAPNILPPGGSANLYDGNCHHVPVRKSGTTISFFVDGVFIGYGDYGSNRNISTTGTLRIAADPVTNGNYFSGWIGEIRIWNTALTDTQIAGNTGITLSPQEGLVAYYDMKDNNQVLTDLSSTLIRNNGFLGSSISTDSFDPAWLMPVQVTCNVDGNFRTTGLFDQVYDMPDSTNTSETSAIMQAYPIPADKEITVQLIQNHLPGASLTVFDLCGTAMIRSVFLEGELSKTFNSAELPQGLYVIQLEVSPGMVVRNKILVSHP